MEKVSTILQYGRLLAQSTEKNSRIFLYKLETFYVSACYRIPNDQLMEICCFKDANQLPMLFYRHIMVTHPAEREYKTPEI